jgi:Ca2+-binding RTX toxin-like protein
LRGNDKVTGGAGNDIYIFNLGDGQLEIMDANGNLLHLDNIANLEWYYNNTLNKLTKADKTTQYNVYDYLGNLSFPV